MNNQRRKQIATLVEDIDSRLSELLSEFTERAQEILDEEQEAFDALPESIQDGERGQAMQEAISNLEDAVGALENMDASEITDALENAAE